MSHTHPTRRDFIRGAATTAAGFALAEKVAGSAALPIRSGTAKSCIFINMVGGPAHLDTFDPKPDAPSDVRGPFKPIRTATPGVHLSELFPKLAKLTDTFSLIRSMHHTAPPVHECGFQLLNTGRLFRDGPEWPSAGAVVAHLLAKPSEAAPWWIAPHATISTGVNVSRGQAQGFFLSASHGPKFSDPDTEVQMDFGALMASACHAMDEGARFVTVNMFNTVFDSPSWDCHADGGSLATSLDDVRVKVAPRFDGGLAHLLEVLADAGRLESTLVVATGEFGRTPKLNSNGGRDHWAGCWTALVAGGGVRGGRVIGRSDRTGSEPADRPVTPQELVATIFYALGVAPDATIPGPDGGPVEVYPGTPIAELF